MPRPVVPILAPGLAASSRARSSSPWIGRISGVFSGDHEGLGRDFHPLGADRLDLLQQVPRVEHHAVADHRQLAAAHHARRQGKQLVDRPVDHQRVPGHCDRPESARSRRRVRSASRRSCLSLRRPTGRGRTTTLAMADPPVWSPRAAIAGAGHSLKAESGDRASKLRHCCRMPCACAGPNEKSVYIGVLTGKLPSTATNLLHGRGELALRLCQLVLRRHAASHK